MERKIIMKLRDKISLTLLIISLFVLGYLIKTTKFEKCPFDYNKYYAILLVDNNSYIIISDKNIIEIDNNDIKKYYNTGKYYISFIINKNFVYIEYDDKIIRCKIKSNTT